MRKVVLTEANKKNCVEAEKQLLFYQFDFMPFYTKKISNLLKQVSMSELISLSLNTYLDDQNHEKMAKINYT